MKQPLILPAMEPGGSRSRAVALTRLPLQYDRALPTQVFAAFVAPVVFGFLVARVGAMAPSLSPVLGVAALLGGLFAGFEHRGAKDAVSRGAVAGLLFGLGVALARHFAGAPATVGLPDSDVLTVVVPCVVGALLATPAGALRERLERAASRPQSPAPATAAAPARSPVPPSQPPGPAQTARLPTPAPEPRAAREPRRRALSIPALPANGAAVAALVLGALGALTLLGGKPLYGFSLALGSQAVTFAVLARQRWRRSPKLGGGTLSAWAAGLGAVAVVAGLYGGLTLSAAKDERPLSAVDPELRDRNRYCSGPAGDGLIAATGDRLDDPRVLDRATDRVLDLAGDAPAGATCAVSALDVMVESWAAGKGRPGFDDADRQVRRIRAFQDSNDLREARF